MSSFSKKIKECRESAGLSQSALAKELGLHHSIIGRYERGEAKPTIDVVVNMARAFETTVGYLLGESEEKDLLKDPAMLKRLNDISSFPDSYKEQILFALDAMIKGVKIDRI